MSSMLTGRRVTKRYGAHTVLNGVDFDLQSGRIGVLMGRSGSGKTTLLRALCLVEAPDYGTVALDSVAYSFPGADQSGPSAFWPDVTVVFQDLFLWPHLTVLQNVSLPARKRCSTSGDQRTAELLASLGIENLKSRYPNEISRGQRQLVALARGLAVKPKFLLVDEITASLDVHSAARAADHLVDSAKNGVGILVITHQIGFAMDVADDFAFLEGGKIVEMGSPAVLKAPNTEPLKAFLSAARRAL